MSDLKKVTALLEDKDPERRAAAAVVVGALELKDAKTLASLAKLLDGAPEEQRAALDAFARLGFGPQFQAGQHGARVAVGG